MSEDKGNVSDGYHTFNELYEHRCLLWIIFAHFERDICYWVRDHYPNWDLLVMELSPNIGQISYHVKSEYRKFYEGKIQEKLLADHVFDGHTPNDVINRLKTLLGDENLNSGDKEK